MQLNTSFLPSVLSSVFPATEGATGSINPSSLACRFHEPLKLSCTTPAFRYYLLSGLQFSVFVTFSSLYKVTCPSSFLSHLKANPFLPLWNACLMLQVLEKLMCCKKNKSLSITYMKPSTKFWTKETKFSEYWYTSLRCVAGCSLLRKVLAIQ